MSFEIGDRVTWSEFPSYGVGTVVPDSFYPTYSGGTAVRFDTYTYHAPAEEGGYHTPLAERLTLVEEGPTFEVGDRVYEPEFGYGTVLETVTEVDVRFDDQDYGGPDGYSVLREENLTPAPGHWESHFGEDQWISDEEPGFKASVRRVLGDGSIVEVADHIPYVEEVKRLRNLPDDVHHPAHYNQGKIEVWDFIYDQGLGYAIGNAIKYEVRAGKKAGNSKVKDLRKAIAFLEREIRFEETGE